jgi:hypothetical protein
MKWQDGVSKALIAAYQKILISKEFGEREKGFDVRCTCRIEEKSMGQNCSVSGYGTRLQT